MSPLRTNSEIASGFATGSVRVLESQLIDHETIKRLAASADLAEARMVLNETEYAREMLRADTAAQIEADLERSLEGTYGLLARSGLPNEVEEYFRCRYDFANLRALLKSGIGEELKVPLARLGMVSPDSIGRKIKDRTFHLFASGLREAAEHAISSYDRTKEIEVVDRVMDKYYFRRLVALAAKLKSPWIAGYTRLLIDTANGRVVKRGRRFKLGPELIETMMIDGGDVGAGAWMRLIESARDSAPDLSGLPLGGIAQKVVKLALGGEGDERYDIRSREMLSSFLMTARKIAIGPEPAFAYTATKENEVGLVRTIIAAVIIHLPPKLIMESIPSHG